MPLVPIVMPQLGESIAEGTVVRFLVSPGEKIAADQEIIEVETQKATMGITALCGGKIESLTAELHETYAVGEVLGHIEATAEEIARTGVRAVDQAQATPAPSAPSQPEPEPAAHVSSDEAKPHFAATDDPPPPKSTTKTGKLKISPTVEGLPVPAAAAGAGYISPRMRARMAELGLNATDLAAVAGSGSGGRVTVRDFERFLEDLDHKKTTPASSMRVAVADSMRRSWARPLAIVAVPLDLDRVLAHRAAQTAPKPGPALYAIRALGLALAEKPALGGRLVGRRIVHPDNLHVGFAVEAEDGVLVPVLRDVDKRPLAELVGEYITLIEKARARRLSPDETLPGVATVTNFGSFGVVWASPIPLPEQNLLLGLGAASTRPAWSEEKQTFVPVKQAQLTLSFDHRVLDGGAAGRLLGHVAELLQSPEDL